MQIHAQIAGAEKTFDADVVVHGAGRIPDIEDLNVKAAEVDSESHGRNPDVTHLHVVPFE